MSKQQFRHHLHIWLLFTESHYPLITTQFKSKKLETFSTQQSLNSPCPQYDFRISLNVFNCPLSISYLLSLMVNKVPPLTGSRRNVNIKWQWTHLMKFSSRQRSFLKFSLQSGKIFSNEKVKLVTNINGGSDVLCK